MTLPGAHNRFGLYNRGSRGMSKLPLHRTRIASIQRLQHWLTRGQGFAADCASLQCRACCKPGGKANDPAPLLPLCDANTPICLVSEPPARSAHSHPPIEWLFALRGQKTEKSIWRDATDAVALARQPLPAVPASARPKSPWPRQCQPCRLEAAPAEVHSPGQETAMGQREVQLDKPALFSTD